MSCKILLEDKQCDCELYNHSIKKRQLHKMGGCRNGNDSNFF